MTYGTSGFSFRFLIEGQPKSSIITVPTWAKPPRGGYRVVAPASTGVDLLNRPIGHEGYDAIVMTWSRIEGRALRWWKKHAPAGSRSVWLSYIRMPHWEGPMNGGVFSGYKEWRRGLLVVPMLGEDSSYDVDHAGSGLVYGSVTVEIRNLDMPK